MLALSVLSTKAQSKISFDVEFGAGTVFSRSKAVVKYSPGAFAYDPNTGTTIFMPGRLKTTNEYKNVLTPQFAFGVKANYTLKQNFKNLWRFIFFIHRSKKKEYIDHS